MSKRIQDLHREMTASGLKNSAQMIEKCFDPSTGRPKLTNSEQNAGNHNNVNQNANYVAGNSQDARSVETIYCEAVAKRVSSSSEEMDFDNSDESAEQLDYVNNSLFVEGEIQPSTLTYQGKETIGQPVRQQTVEEYVSLQLCAQNRRRKWHFPLNFRNGII